MPPRRSSERVEVRLGSLSARIRWTRNIRVGKSYELGIALGEYPSRGHAEDDYLISVAVAPPHLDAYRNLVRSVVFPVGGDLCGFSPWRRTGPLWAGFPDGKGCYR